MRHDWDAVSVGQVERPHAERVHGARVAVTRPAVEIAHESDGPGREGGGAGVGEVDGELGVRAALGLWSPFAQLQAVADAVQACA